MIKESSGFNTNKMYLSLEDYKNLFNFLSKIVSLETLGNTSLSARYDINSNMRTIIHSCRRIDCTDFIAGDNILQMFKKPIGEYYNCDLSYDKMYRDYINEDLVMSVILCTPQKQSKENQNYIHPIAKLDLPIFADDYDHIYLFIDSRLCTNDNFIKEINKVNREEDIYSQDYNPNQYPIKSRADYFNKMMDEVMKLVCRNCEHHIISTIKKYNSILSYTIFDDGKRFKGSEKKKINKAIDYIMNNAIDLSLEYVSISSDEKLRVAFKLLEE